MQLVIVDTTRIQPYIFGSHRLRENIGASWLVSQATSAWAFDALRTAGVQHNLAGSDDTLDATRRIEDGQLDAEVVYSGGGNFVAIFAEPAPAEAFIRRLSQRVLCEAPGLNLVFVSEAFQWNENLQTEAWPRAFQKLADAKRAHVPDMPLLGLGVTQICRSSGLPAVGFAEPDKPDRKAPAAAEVLAKLEVSQARGPARDQLHRQVGEPDEGLAYPAEFDDLGRSHGEFSYIAVVHADGNDMGQRFEGIKATGNRDYLTQLRQLSSAVNGAGERALRSLLAKLQGPKLTGDGEIGFVFRHSGTGEASELDLALERAKDGETHYLPFRPIVFGGDDVTFVCDGRLGVSAAVAYLEAFEHEARELPGGPGSASAGIAIVKSHYPFARAYQLAEDLCRNAKTFRRDRSLTGGSLDWHLAQSGLAGDIATIRKREYQARDGRALTLRPVALNQESGAPLRTWPIVLKGLEAFQQEDWRERRNKVKELREVLRDGESAVKWFLQKYGGTLPLLDADYVDLNAQGWHSNQCGYFDAIELMDGYLPL